VSARSVFGCAARRKQFEPAALLDICAALDHEAILMTTFGTAS
jgi:hypothetical protein